MRDYVMEAWGSLVDCPCESSFDEYLKNFEMACSSWPMFVDYVCQTWVIPHKERFVKAWTNKVMHLGNTTTNRVESAHWSLKRLLQNFLGDICSVWEAMNNMMTLQHTQMKASFETSMHIVGHLFKVTLYKKTTWHGIKDSIENIIDVKADGNCGFRTIAALLGMGEESWSLVHNHLHKELTSWSEEYINMVTMDKWINITDMRYVIASRYNLIVVSLS
ncbi:hypothetical protein HKD37_01G001818 [Glycine soja]